MTTAVSTSPASSVSTAAPKTFRELILQDGYKNQLAAALPRGMSADRMVRVVLTAFNKTPKLLECSKETVWESVLNCAALGLFPDALGRAYLVPYKGKCQLIIGYKGLIDLAYRSERIASINLVIVREGDEFERLPMESPPIRHRVVESPDGKFRPMTHVYSVVYLKGCAMPSIDVMSLREVREIRERSMSKDSGPWVTDFEEMAKKTVFRRHAKVLPMSAEMAQAFDSDGDQLDLNAVAATRPTSADDIAPKTRDTTAEHVEGAAL
jgi:recombination protein RecT